MHAVNRVTGLQAITGPHDPDASRVSTSADRALMIVG